MNIHEAYLEAEKGSGLKVGDKVLVTRKADHHELGWKNCWSSDMNSHIGQVMTIENISTMGNGIRMLEQPLYQFPFFVLELIE